ncbi:4-(cytidine 5'-diphospho)-2-C-methyl-D-erythritol kinase [Thioalkalivibrio sp. ALJT]|uniref:4-(cytidine 5'-diphospho)-2-C-methyl-D-erythritol kinase n=1 Tax=Thioalkalivibrio sp. ALJT TaxID=1158146 RepID=UPI00037DC48A|nr:4-(cytidine 5'-diphospho)-2-C-methyl-D-erythritol kinase [Thioalkalivibrio sp. ALJT]
MSIRADGGFDSVFPAPAKINRFLHVTGRRADGYHELQTVFQFLGLADQLRFEPLPAGRYEMAGAAIDGADNLCLRAARRLAAEAARDFGVRIHLDKHIPVGGGLGGGSSDAATTLVALNHLFGLGQPVDRLAALGLELGADVPVFVAGCAAWAEGVGERLTPVAPGQGWVLLIDPGVSVTTGAMFGAAELTRDCPTETISSEFDAGRFGNVFEPVVRARYPEVDRALAWLASETPSARLSGSGGCVFGIFPDQAAAQQAQSSQPEAWASWVTPLLNVSPLQAWLPPAVSPGA